MYAGDALSLPSSIKSQEAAASANVSLI